MKKQPVPVQIPEDISLEEPSLQRAAQKKHAESLVLPALGIDYGTKFVGIALAAAPLAQPLTIAANNDHLLSYVCTLIDDYQIRTVVIGVSERRTADFTHQFANRLKATVSAKIVFADETLTTQVVRAKLRAAGRRIKPDERIDHYAAAEILQDWLDTHQRQQVRI